MNIQQSLLVTMMLVSALSQGCTRTAKTAEKAPTPVKLSSTVGSEAWNSRDLKSRPH